jgi:glycosyltransferase involved in cell wall biosynthesis
VTLTIAHVFGAMDRGGAELRTIAVASITPEVRHVYITLSGRRGELADQIEDNGGLVFPCRLSVIFPLRFWRFLRQLRPDVLDSNVATFSGALILLAWLAGVPRRIAHFRSDRDQHGNSAGRRLQRRLMRALIHVFATDVVGNAPGALAFASSHHERTTGSVIPDGVPVGPEPVERQGESLRLVHVARTLPTKRRDRAIAIVAAARAAGLRVSLRLVGAMTGPETSMLRQLAEALDVTDIVAMDGPTDDVAEALREADALLVTSTREGLPGVVMEALAQGCPVISTNLPGITYIRRFCLGITTVDLASEDSEWVDALRALSAPHALSRRQIWDSFKSSPFTLDRAAAEMRSLWLASI